MNTHVAKLDLIHWITELQDTSVLAQVAMIKENSFVVSPLEQMSIERGLEDFRKGNVTSHLEVRKRYEKWL